MKQIFSKPQIFGQAIAGILIIIFGAAYSIRGLIAAFSANNSSLAGNIFCAVCFAAMAYVSGYRYLLRGAIDELRSYYTNLD